MEACGPKVAVDGASNVNGPVQDAQRCCYICNIARKTLKRLGKRKTMMECGE